MTTSTFLHFGAQTRKWTPPSTGSLPIGSDRNRFEVVGSISSTTLTTRFSCEARETLDRRLVFVQGFDRARHPGRVRGRASRALGRSLEARRPGPRLRNRLAGRALSRPASEPGGIALLR